MRLSAGCKSVVVGAYGFRNVGDESILRGLVLFLRGEGKEVVVVSRDPDQTSRLHGVRAVPFGYRVLARVLSDPSVCELVVGGGELFQDHMVWSYLMCILVARAVSLVRRRRLRVRVLGVGVDLSSRFWMYLLRLFVALRLVDEFVVRDFCSFRDLRLRRVLMDKDFAYVYLRSVSLPVSRSDYAVFVLRPSRDAVLNNVMVSLFSRLVAVILRADVVERIFLLPFSLHPDSVYDNDLVFMERVFREACLIGGSSVRGRLFLVRSFLDPLDAFGFIANARFVVSSRLHPLIFADVAGVPALAVALHRKVLCFANMRGISCVDFRGSSV